MPKDVLLCTPCSAAVTESELPQHVWRPSDYWGATRPGCTWAQAPLALLLSAQLAPAAAPPGAPAPHGAPRACRAAARVSLRSPVPGVIAALQADLPAFLAELFSGAFMSGAGAEGPPHAAPGTVHIPAALARDLGWPARARSRAAPARQPAATAPRPKLGWRPQ